MSGRLVSRLMVALLGCGLIASACTGTATVTQTGSSSDGDTPEPVETPGVEPTAQSAPVKAPEPTASPEPTPALEPTPAATLPPVEFRADTILGISNGGTYACAGTTSSWFDETPCDVATAESLSVVNIAVAARGEFAGVVAGVAAGFEQVGDVRQLLPGSGSSAVLLSSCGTGEDPALWLNRVEFGQDGRIASVGNRLDLGGTGERDPYLIRWVDDDTIEARVIIEIDPDDAATWLVERRQISLTTGQAVSIDQFGYFDDAGFANSPVLATSAGFTYRVIDDPAGGIGGEGFGVARTLEVDNGTDRRLALTQPTLVFSDVNNLHLAPTGHIAWISGCEGFVNAFVGKILDNGSVADAHLVETYTLPNSEFADYQFFRLTNDGFLAAVGWSFDLDSADTNVALLRYDLNTDPHFINTADPALQIDVEPLFEAVGGDGTWHVGDTLATDPACGSRTLYGKTAGGFVRAFPAGQEVDQIVDIDLGETYTVKYDFGDDFVSRTVVMQTECAGSYEGRRVWFGTEFAGIIWGLYMEPADLSEVADVLAIRDVVQAGTDFVETTIVQVELLDGSVVEVEVVALPFDG